MPIAVRHIRRVGAPQTVVRKTDAATAQADQPETPPAGTRCGLGGLAASALLHASLIVIWAVCRLPADAQQDGPSLRTILGLHEEHTLPEPPLLTVPDPAQAAPSPDAQLAIARGAQLAHPELALVEIGPPITSELLGSPDGLADLTLPAGGLGQRPAGNGSGEGDGGDFLGEPARVHFFGAEAEGVSFAFVVDCSTSMTKLNSEGLKSRFAYAMAELAAAIEQLGPQQELYVVFYNHQTFPMGFPKRAWGLLPASDENRRRVGQWVRQLSPGGGTMPVGAMRLALGLEPDVVFFLTDGEIPPMTRQAARMATNGKTVVHTIAFGSLRGEGVLRGIAADHEGTFRFVP